MKTRKSELLGEQVIFYFVFTMDDDCLRELSPKLVQQAGNISRKVLKMIFEKEALG